MFLLYAFFLKLALMVNVGHAWFMTPPLGAVTESTMVPSITTTSLSRFETTVANSKVWDDPSYRSGALTSTLTSFIMTRFDADKFSQVSFPIPATTLILLSEQSSSPQPSFASKQDVLSALSNPKAVIVDVRTQGEIDTTGRIIDIEGAAPKLKTKQWIHSDCTRLECPELESRATSLLRGDKSIPIVVHCASGKRSSTAKQVLELQGYSNVLNAGGFQDFQDILLQ